MKTTHTPGPWNCQLTQLAHDPNDESKGFYTNENYYEIKAGIGHFSFDREPEGFGITGYMKESDAKLITSAPEMLEAIEKICSLPEYRNGMSPVWNEGFRSGVMEAIRIAHAAMIKATE